MRSRNSIQLAALSAFLLLAVGSQSFGQDQIQWLDDLDQAKAIAARDGKLLLVHFWSERCGPCKNLDTFVFPRPDVVRAVHKHCIPVKVNTDQNRGLTASLQIDRIPQDVFMLPDGNVVAQQISPSKANHYIQLVSAVAERAASGSPSQGMNGLSAGRARIAGLQSSSDSVPVVSASDFGAPTPGQGIGGNAPSIQVTDRMDPRQDAAALSENYANNFGQPQAGYGLGNNQRQAPLDAQPSVTNPYATAARSANAVERDALTTYASAARQQQGFGNSPATQELGGEMPRGAAPQIPPYQAAAGLGIAVPAGTPSPSQPPAQADRDFTANAGANRPATATENPLTSPEDQYGQDRFSNPAGTAQPPSAADWQRRQANNGLALPPGAARSRDEVVSPTNPSHASSVETQPVGERQYADPARFAVSPVRQPNSSSSLAADRGRDLPDSYSSGTRPDETPAQAGSRSDIYDSASQEIELALPPDALREFKLRQNAGTTPSQQAGVPPQGNSQGAPTSRDGEPEIALEGYCPITLVEHRTWQRGKKEFGCIHRGKLYLFFTAADRDRFLQYPDRFAPMLSGYDPVIFADRKELVEGKREHGVFAGGRVYMFASEQTLNQFYSRVDHYTAVTHQAMGLPTAPTLTAQGNQSEVQR